MMHADTLIEETAASNQVWERRTTPRVHCCGERLAWKLDRSRRSRKGWLNDVSTMGVSFLIESKRVPAAGETVQLRTDKRGESRNYQVVRVTPEGDDLALVACVMPGKAEAPVRKAA